MLFAEDFFGGFGCGNHLPVLCSAGKEKQLRLLRLLSSGKQNKTKQEGDSDNHRKAERETEVITNRDYNYSHKQYLQLIISPSHKQ